jgi:hypothetical protein
MELIQEKKKDLLSKLTFNLCQIGYALHSRLCYTNRIDLGINDFTEYAAQLQNGDSIFISTRESKVSINLLTGILRARRVHVIFYIMEEPLISWEVVQLLLTASNKIFIQNNTYDHPGIHIMPIGIRDCGTIVAMHQRFNQKYLLDQGLAAESRLFDPRSIKCLLCFSVWTHPTRKVCYDLFCNASFVYNLNDDPTPEMREAREKRDTPEFSHEKVPEVVVYQKTLESQYAFCPRGCGVDTHRFYECIYLGCIPIVIRTNTVFDRLYNVFPCMIIDKWEDVTEELLDQNYIECSAKMRRFHEKYPNFLSDLKSIGRLLKKM